MSYRLEVPNYAASNELAFESIPDMRYMPLSTAPTIATGTVFFTFRTAVKTATISNARTCTGTTNAGATPTLCKVGLYSVDSSGNLTLVASTANTTSLWAGTFTAYNTALSASYVVAEGQRYASAVLIVTAAAAPSLIGANAPWDASITALSPRVAGQLTGQTDLPASVSAGSVANQAKVFAVGFN